MKKLACIIITLTLIFTLSCEAFAGYFPQNGGNPGAPDNLGNLGDPGEYFDPNMQISGTNSFGNMLSSAIGDELAEQQENAGFNVFSVEISGQTATVELETLRDSTVVVGIYDEPGEKLLMTASAPATRDDEFVTVEFEQTLPQYFFIKAYLVDSSTLRPLCTVYDCPNYTQEMQEFFAKTVYDFDREKVLNLDGDVTNNFAVYSDNVTVIPRVEGVNRLISQGGGVYVFENADENILNLQAGQIFSYEFAPGEVIIAKVAAVTANPDGTVTVTEQDAELEEAFEYIKIDTEAGMDKATVDNSHLQEGVTYVGDVDEDAEEHGLSPAALDGDLTASGSKKYEIDIKDFGDDVAKVSIKGSVTFSIISNVKYYVTLKYQYVECTLKYKSSVSLSVDGKVTGKFEIGDFAISPVAGLYIGMTPSVLVEFSLKLTLNGTASGSVGFSYSSTEGSRNISKPIKFSSKLELEGKVYLGFSLEPYIKIIDEKIAIIKLIAKAGLELTAKTAIYDSTTVGKQIHDCLLCFEGELDWVIDLGYKASLFDWDKLTISKTWQFKQKIFDYYYSVGRDEIGLGKCPHIKYKIDVTVTDMAGDVIEGAEVSVSDGQKFTTGEDGHISELFLSNGWYTITAKFEDRTPCTKKIYIHNSGDSVVLPIGMKFASGGGSSWNPDIGGSGGGGGGSWGDGDYLLPDGSKRVKQVSLGNYHSAVLTEDGCVYTWGDNRWGQLGLGIHGGLGGGYHDTYDVTSPELTLRGVKSIKLSGDVSSAITKDGLFYVWGKDANGYTLGGSYAIERPYKIAEDVASIEWLDAIYGHVVIDNAGSLYQYNFIEKELVMNNVSITSSNNYMRHHYALITTDGSLYTWGDNHYGQLGNGTTWDSSVPIKILDNVASVSLGNVHSAAITTDGSLYMWGGNSDGQLGNGTTVDSSVPTKIMDNVILASLEDYNSAAITADGSLYMWGENDCGQLGNGKSGYGEKENRPVKIMDNVASVSLGYANSAAITNDGSLYTWGGNFCGELGNGTTDDSNVPIKIMDNVASVSFGDSNCAAITIDGSLYMWGENCDGQLGNGKSGGSDYEYNDGIDSNVPIKITIPADEPAEGANSAGWAAPLALADDALTSGTFSGLLPNETYNIYALRSRTAAEPMAASNLLYIAQATSDAAGNLPYNCKLLADCPNPVIFCKAMREFDLENAQISAADITQNSITVKWDAFPEADLYRVYRVMNGVYILEGETNLTEFTVSGLAAGREYGFVVECRVNGEWSYRAADDVIYLETEAEPEFAPGDVNGDGNVTLDDAILTLKKAMNVSLEDEQFNEAAADVTGEGEVTLDDAIEILKIAMKVS